MTSMLSIASIVTLTGCSAGTSQKAPDFKVTIEREAFAHPRKPARPRIQNETFLDCGVKGYICMTKADAKRIPANKLEASRVIKEQDALIDYYRCFGSVPDGGRPTACAKLSNTNNTK